MKRRFSPYSMPPWLRTCRNACQQCIIPICIFQGIRTFFFPTTFDVLLLALLILIAVAFQLEWF
ncbi:hypothetical protein ACFVHQ_00540 [Actinomycetes bacterium NPDC127524]|uniref:hypothetical protein n=1 Tax=unclassified Bacillus (in: firmicutes) TaxID=185979 RepID=UPI0009F555E0|nr:MULTISPECIES: hypothetical protein [unclassified Bacillus (in: firmicutes)]